MGKHYLFFVSLTYSFSILRPLQDEIWRRGDDVAWFIEDSCESWLTENEKQLKTIQEVLDYNPIAVFAPGNFVYDFFPGVKVAVFHGYPINKRADKIDDHFTIRGWFDIYCTQGENSTLRFKELEKKCGFFKVYETGWCKVDEFFKDIPSSSGGKSNPTILYSSTFTKGVSSAPYLLETITRLVSIKSWNWILTLHPKFDDQEVINGYKHLAKSYDNVTFNEGAIDANLLRSTDVMLCDSSSIIIEFMLFNKPVVTFRNTHPGNHLLDVINENEIGDAIEMALTRPKELMDNIYTFTMHHESHRDGKNSARVLDAVDDFIANYKGKIKSKPLNFIRKIKLRLKIKHYHW